MDFAVCLDLISGLKCDETHSVNASGTSDQDTVYMYSVAALMFLISNKLLNYNVKHAAKY